MLKSLLQNKKNINYKKLKEFCESSSLRFIGKKVEEDLSLKNLLHK
jgi:hypothetical protein